MPAAGLDCRNAHLLVAQNRNDLLFRKSLPLYRLVTLLAGIRALCGEKWRGQSTPTREKASPADSFNHLGPDPEIPDSTKSINSLIPRRPNSNVPAICPNPEGDAKLAASTPFELTDLGPAKHTRRGILGKTRLVHPMGQHVCGLEAFVVRPVRCFRESS
jgi:hypothetical protein